MSPTNLISALRLSLDLWKRENQVKNVQAIIKRGTALYEKIVGFTDTFLTLGDRMATLQKDYDKALNQLSEGNGSVVRQAEMLKDMSLTPKKRISARLLPKEADIMKVAVMPEDYQDLLNLLSFTVQAKHEYAQKPIVTMSMSSIGLTSRLVGEQFGSAITFATVGKASAPGQIDYQELNQMLDIIHKNIQEA